MKIKILFDLNENIQGKATHFTEGEIADVPDEDAERMIAALEALSAQNDEATELPKKRKKEATKWQPEEL